MSALLSTPSTLQALLHSLKYSFLQKSTTAANTIHFLPEVTSNPKSSRATMVHFQLVEGV